MKTIKMIATLFSFLFLGVALVYAERLLVLRLGTECTLLASISIAGLLLAMLCRAPEGDFAPSSPVVVSARLPSSALPANNTT